MLTHYRELLRSYKKTILLASLSAGGIALVLSVFLLRAMPLYEASVTLNMQPSIEELQFNRSFMGVSQFNPATIIAQTHIESILSRPVAARAIDILIEQNNGNLPSEPPSVFDVVRAFVIRSIKILNFGYFVEQSEREIYITDLIGATKIEIVEGSYIMMISIVHKDPNIAARAANALSQAYIEQRQVDFSNDANRVDQTLKTIRQAAKDRLADQVNERRAMETEVGITGTAIEKEQLLNIRNSAQVALDDAEIHLAELNTRMEKMQEAIRKSGDARIAQKIRQDIVNVQASVAESMARLKIRKENLKDAEAALRIFDLNKDAFQEIDQRIADTRLDLAELQQRAIQIELAREARLSQVSIINQAQVPIYPKFPKIFVNTIIGLILGAIMTIVPISAFDALGQKLRTTEDLRESFGGRSLPALTPKLLIQSQNYLEKGGKPAKELFNFAEQAGQVISLAGSKSWPSEAFLITSMTAQVDLTPLMTVMSAVIDILGRQQSDGTPLMVEILAPLPMIINLKSLSNQHVIVGFSPAENSIRDVAVIAQSLQDNTTAFGILL